MMIKLYLEHDADEPIIEEVNYSDHPYLTDLQSGDKFIYDYNCYVLHEKMYNFETNELRFLFREIGKDGMHHLKNTSVYIEDAIKKLEEVLGIKK